MIQDQSKRKNGPIVVDLQGPQGNAFYLIGIAQSLAKTFCWSPEERDSLTNNMMSGDYEHLLHTLDRAFGEYIILQR